MEETFNIFISPGLDPADDSLEISYSAIVQSRNVEF